MPLNLEFQKHLRSLAREVQESTSDELEQHKKQRIYNAYQTHNAAAVPIAYKDAALYSVEQRVRRTIEKYLEAIESWGISIDAAFENDMLREFWSLTSGPNHLQFPPLIFKPTLPAVQQSYAQERGRLAKRLVIEGTNRLRELKMKMQKLNRAIQPPTTNISNIFNGSVGTANIGSTIHITNNIAFTAQMLDDIDRLSEGNSELESAALEVRNAQAQGTNLVDKLQKWTVLVNTVAGLSEKIHQYFPQIAALLEHLKPVRG